MKFEITVYESDDSMVQVRNCHSEEYHYPRKDLHLLKNDSLLLPTGLAKNLFGDWDALGTYAEEYRRKQKGISRFELTVKHEKREIKEEIKNEEGVALLKEEEFTSLKETTVMCQAITKSGNPCKREALPETKYCALHKRKEE